MSRLIWRLVIALVVSLSLTISVAWLALQSYQRLSSETLIAELTFEKIGQQKFQANLLSGSFCQPQQFLILGDQWRIDAQFLKWKAWATVMGFDSRYLLERLEGRYQQVNQQNTRPRIAHSLIAGRDEVIQRLSAQLFLPLFVDAEYGSSTFQTIDTDQIYQVFKTPTGLITRQRPNMIQRDEDGALVIEITHACAGSA